ncbi:hypothetical protein KR059_012087, partial [Drosophila kikkawai]
ATEAAMPAQHLGQVEIHLPVLPLHPSLNVWDQAVRPSPFGRGIPSGLPALVALSSSRYLGLGLRSAIWPMEPTERVAQVSLLADQLPQRDQSRYHKRGVVRDRPECACHSDSAQSICRLRSPHIGLGIDGFSPHRCRVQHLGGYDASQQLPDGLLRSSGVKEYPRQASCRPTGLLLGVL